jgi:ABC-type transport system involved in multi-copper enzyme maturation permease subunit
MRLAIETEGLGKRYGDVTAVDALSLRVTEGEIYAFLGLNGAGKTTTIRMLLGMIRPTTDWSAYLALTAQRIAAGGFFLFCLIVCWAFGREFVDGTLKDMLAVPVPRASILLAKFIVAAVWSAALAGLIFFASLAAGALIGLPGGSTDALLHGAVLVAGTTSLTIAVVLPFLRSWPA